MHTNLYLMITKNGKSSLYHVARLEPQEAVASVAYRLSKMNKETYHVHVDCFGAHCECWSCLTGPGPCKHILALVQEGLLPQECIHGKTQVEGHTGLH